MQVNVHEAKTRLSQLLELVEGGESVIIARNGRPVAELVKVKRTAGFPFGIARHEPLVGDGDEWWQPLEGEDLDAWTKES